MGFLIFFLCLHIGDEHVLCISEAFHTTWQSERPAKREVA